MKPRDETLADRSGAAGEGPRSTDRSGRTERNLLAGYLHKTSNTLCGIKGYASLIAQEEAEPGKAGAWARKIIAEVERMEEIFRSVGDMTRGRSHPDEGVDLPGLVHDLVGDFSRTCPGLDVRVTPIPEGGLLVPVADLALMIKEALKNCAESRPEESVRVRAEIGGITNPDGRVVLVISDDGCGMDPGLAAQAPRPFVTTKEGHIGVGCTRIDTLMEMYGLGWKIESDPGSGTRVSLEVAEVC